MRNIEEGLGEPGRYNLNLWKKALGCFLGWDSARVSSWAEQYYDKLKNDDWFSGEDALHFIVRLLIPDELGTQLSRDERKDLESRLAISINVGAVEWPQRIVELHETLPITPEGYMEIAEVSDKARAEGKYLSGDLDIYDWEAAKQRIEGILSDYKGRDRVPGLARDLLDPDPAVRMAAARQLARMGRLAAPATRELVEVVERFPGEKVALFAMEALDNIRDHSPKVLQALENAAMASDPDIRRRARYVHYRLSCERRSWDN